MGKLVEQCIEFVATKIHDVVRLPIDMNCLNSTLLKRISRKVKIDDLDGLRDKKDRLQSRLFMKKLEIMIEDDTNQLSRCVYCN
jgi:hypothetical protein